MCRHLWNSAINKAVHPFFNHTSPLKPHLHTTLVLSAPEHPEAHHTECKGPAPAPTAEEAEQKVGAGHHLHRLRSTVVTPTWQSDLAEPPNALPVNCPC